MQQTDLTEVSYSFFLQLSKLFFLIMSGSLEVAVVVRAATRVVWARILPGVAVHLRAAAAACAGLPVQLRPTVSAKER